MIAPEWVVVSGFGRRRSLSDLAVWGFPEFSRKIFPLKPFPTLPHPFHPFFSHSTLSSNSLTSQNPSFNSLDRAHSPFLSLLPPFYSSQSLLTPFSPFLSPYRTLTEHLRNPSIGSPKGPKQSFLGLFRGTPKTPKKGLKTPFLTPFSPLPYPL